MNDLSPKIRYRVLECPHCNQPINVGVKTEILEINIPIESVDGLEMWFNNLSDSQKEVITIARKSGMITAFERTVRRVKGEEMPRNIENFFLTFLKTSRAKDTPAFLKKYLRREFGDGEVEFWAAQGIGVALVNKAMCTFIPADLVNEKRVREGIGVKIRVKPNETEFSEWVRTRYGFVSSRRSGLFSELQKKSIGDFVSVRI